MCFVKRFSALTLFVLICCAFTFIGCETEPSSRPINRMTANPNYSGDMNKIAVFALSKPYMSQVQNHFMEVLVNKGYDVVSREDLKIIIRENELRGITAEKAVSFVRDMGVDAVLLVEITNIKIDKQQGIESIRNISMAARLVSVKNSKVIWIKTKNYNPSILEQLIKLPFQIIAGREDLLLIVANDILAEFPSRY